MHRFLILICFMAFIGCTPKETIDLSAQTVASLQLASVEVDLPPDRQMRWGHLDRRVGERLGVTYPAPVKDVDGGEAAYEKKLAEFQAAIDTPEGRGLRQSMTREVVANAINREVRPVLSGSRPVTMRVTIENLVIPGAFMRNIIGGTPMMRAYAEIVDQATGQVLAKSPSYTVFEDKRVKGVIGLIGEAFASDPFDGLSQKLAKEIKDWLKPVGSNAS
jgi:hypothetical protein